MNQNLDVSAMFCVGCGQQLVNDWEFCPLCGTHRAAVPPVEVETTPQIRSEAQSLGNEVKLLIDEGRLDVAEGVVTEALTRTRDIDMLIIAADVYARLFKVNETADLLDEALQLMPTNYLLRIRRAEHFGRVGLYPQAFEEIRLARRHLPAGELSIFMYCQELERLFRDRSRGGFVMAPALPKLPSLRIGLKKRKALPSPEVTDSKEGF